MYDELYDENIIELSKAKENAMIREEQAYMEFRAFLDAEGKLYQHSQTYYLRMRYIDSDTKKHYNEIKNELMSHISNSEPSLRVRYELTEEAETFYLQNLIAQFRVSGGVLLFYLHLDPSKYNTSDAMHKDVSDDPRFANTPLMLKVNKTTRVKKAISMVRDLVANSDSKKDDDYINIDYASFFSRDALYVSRTVTEEDGEEAVEQVVAITAETDIRSDDVIILGEDTGESGSASEEAVTQVIVISTGASEDETEANTDETDIIVSDETRELLEAENDEYLETVEEIEETREEVYTNISDPQERPTFRDSAGIKREPVRPQGSYEEDKKTIFTEIERKEEAEGKKKKKSLWQELSSYGYNFVLLKQLLFYMLALALAVGLGLVYKLKWPFILCLVITVLLGLPSVLKAYFRNKYEEKRYRDVESYIEQMLYSFRRNSKILMSLNDALVVFPNGYMHDRIIEAIDHIRSSRKEGNVYAQALRIIERAYPCRRIKSLHRYMIKVENVGGKHESGVNALLKDRRQWIDRTAMFRKQCSALIKEILISGIFSLIMACAILYMMPSNLYDLSSSLAYQIVTTIFVIVNLLVIRTTLKSTVVYLQDDDDEQAKRTVKLINWLRNYDAKAEFKKALKTALIFIPVAVLGTIQKNLMLIILGAALFLFTAFLKPRLSRSSAMKRAKREIEKVYPDWLLELALLLQTDNLHVAIEKTLSSAPIVLQYDLNKLADDIVTHPVDLAPYVAFFDFLPMENVQSSMKLLYSISTFGAVDESVQISELVERNHTLMEQAEKLRNDDKLARVFTVKFVPMLSSSVKMLADLMIFLFSYLSLVGDLF